MNNLFIRRTSNEVPRLRVQRLWPRKTQRSLEGIRLNIHIIMNKFVIVVVFFFSLTAYRMSFPIL